MKKLTVLIIMLLCLTISAEAKTVREAAKEAVDFFGVEQGAFPDAYKKCKNYRTIAEDDIALASDAIGFGLLIPQNGVLNMDSEDLTPIIDGITSYGIKSGYKVVTEKFTNGEFDKAPVSDNTFVLEPLEKEKVYTALIKNNVCVAAVPTGEVKKPTLYKARLYVADGNFVSFVDVMRYSLGKWMDAGCGDNLMFCEMYGTNISADVLNNYMDKTVYFYADKSDPIVKIYSMRYE